MVVWALLAFGALDVLLRGTRDDWAFFLPPVALFAWLLWLVLWAPRLIVEPGRLVARDVLRTFALPWASITAIAPGTMLRIDYLDAAGRPRTLRPWNALGARTGRPDGDAASVFARARTGRGGPLPSAPRVSETDVLLDAWNNAERGPERAEPPRWHVWEIVMTGLLIAACVAPHVLPA